jgi:hypothetical protein
LIVEIVEIVRKVSVIPEPIIWPHVCCIDLRSRSLSFVDFVGMRSHLDKRRD